MNGNMRAIDAEALDYKGLEFSDGKIYVQIEAIWDAPTLTKEEMMDIMGG